MSLRVERLIFPSQVYDYIAAECHMAFLPDEECLRTTVCLYSRRGANTIDRDLFNTRMRFGSRGTLVTPPKLNPVESIPDILEAA
jgi:hypothetical protein